MQDAFFVQRAVTSDLPAKLIQPEIANSKILENKMKIKPIKVFLQLATVLFVAGFCSIAQAQIVVNLKVSSNQGALEATTRGSCARQPNNNGCVAASGQTQINFTLSSPNCNAGGKWELTHVALGNGNKASPGNISAVAAQDFGANQSTGVVSPQSQSGNHILIRDDNSQAYDIWYTVYARCTGNGATIATDPRVENDGSGGQ
jgi:hypothetical protein